MLRRGPGPQLLSSNPGLLASLIHSTVWDYLLVSWYLNEGARIRDGISHSLPCLSWSLCDQLGWATWVEEANVQTCVACTPGSCFYQTRSAWSIDQGSTRKCSAVHNFAPTVTKFCVMWEGLSFPHDTKFGNCRGEIVDRRMIFIWSLIHGSGWSGLIKAEPVDG